MTAKVCIVLPAHFTFSAEKPNSIETVVRTINRQSRLRGNLTIICDSGADCGDDYEVIKVPAYRSRRQRNRFVRDMITDLQPDLLEIHQHAPSGRKIARTFPDIPSLLYRHNVVRAPEGGFARWRYERRYGAFGGHIFVSDFARNSFAEAFPKFASVAFSVPNPIDLSAWRAPASGEKEKLITFTGRAAPEKGLAPFAEALSLLLERFPDWQAEMALGDWNKHAEWAGSVLAPLARFGERCRVRHNLPLEEVKHLQRRAAITVIPSIWDEPFGLVALEAHACEVAVVSSGSGGLREASGDFARYLERVDAASIVASVERLIEDEPGRLVMAKGGRLFVGTYHTVAIRAHELDAIRDSYIHR